MARKQSVKCILDPDPEACGALFVALRATRKNFDDHPPVDRREKDVCKMALGFLVNLGQDMRCGVLPLDSDEIVRICKTKK